MGKMVHDHRCKKFLLDIIEMERNDLWLNVKCILYIL